MKTKNIILLGAITILIIAVLIYAGLGTQTTNNNNTTNDTVTITLNETNNTTENQTTTKTTTKKSTTKSNEPEIISDTLRYNYQVDDGSYYRQVEYSDGNFRQIDTNGKIIGSSYSSDHVDSPSME